MKDDANLAIPTPKRAPWNKGKLIGAKPPLRQKHVWAIRTLLQVERSKRDLAMFNLAIDSKLRGCDVVGIRVDDVAPNGYAIDRATVRQRKTGRPVRFELTRADTPGPRRLSQGLAQEAWRVPIFGSKVGAKHDTAPIWTTWLIGIGLDPHLYGTHSLRRTKATLIYRRTGNLRAVQLLLGHTKIESTVRYLGIDVDDALAIAE